MNANQKKMTGTFRKQILALGVACSPLCQAFQVTHVFRQTQRNNKYQPFSSSSSSSLNLSSSEKISPNADMKSESNANHYHSPLSMNLDELTTSLNGKGKAQAAWDCLRVGVDPLLFHNPSYPQQQLDNALSLADGNISARTSTSKITSTTQTQITTREQIQQHLPARRQTQMLGGKALEALSRNYPSSLGIEPSLATLDQITRSNDGTTKLLLKLTNTNFFIETVIIPHPEWNKSTLCISSQVGCAQGCVFCATGKMGELGNLTSDQILIQLYYANKVCRVTEDLPPIDGIVFMGMGDASRNVAAVRKAVDVMTDRSCFALAPSKITISTVGPNPGVFAELAEADAVLAWSVHAVRDDLRKRLVPTTKYSMKELGDGLVQALTTRSKRLKSLMLEVTLMDGINDGAKEAEEMAAYALDLKSKVPGMKLIINLIPFNDIGYEMYRRASAENVAQFQKILVESGINTYVRTTRGDDESAACGQLATNKRKRSISRSDSDGAAVTP